MSKPRTWVLTGDDAIRNDEFDLGPNSVPELDSDDWYIRRYFLRGGLRDGVELVEINNGPLTFQVLPTRGMGIWKGNFRGTPFGWHAPVNGPVHPKFVNLADRGGLGWLAGFDEFLVRCGLFSNGPPGNDNGTPLPLHGRIANCPAHRVEVKVDPTDGTLAVTGIVEEGGLFLGRLRLTSTLSTRAGSNQIVVRDEVQNLSAQPAEMQLLYHVNTGEPFLEAGSKVVVPFRELAPHTAHAAKALDTWDTYRGPTTGFPEEVFDFKPAANAAGQSVALLHNSSRNIGLAVRWKPEELPCFIVWKNTIAHSDGFVTGLEPSTNFTYFKSHERSQGRVVTLPPGAKWSATVTLDMHDSRPDVDKVIAEIAAIQASAKPTIHQTPVWAPKTN